MKEMDDVTSDHSSKIKGMEVHLANFEDVAKKLKLQVESLGSIVKEKDALIIALNGQANQSSSEIEVVKDEEAKLEKSIKKYVSDLSVLQHRLTMIGNLLLYPLEKVVKSLLKIIQ